MGVRVRVRVRACVVAMVDCRCVHGWSGNKCISIIGPTSVFCQD